MIINSKHPFLTLSQQFSTLCEPLIPFKIHHLTYVKRFFDGSRITLCNKPSWIEDYYNLNLFDSSLFEDSPRLYQAEFNLWLGDYDLEVYKHGKNYYNSTHSITITEPHPDGCEFFLFATAPEYSREINFLANNREILYRFILYLKDQGASLFKSAHKHKLVLKKNSGLPKSSKNSLTDPIFYQKMQEAKFNFLSTTPIRQYIYESKEKNRIKFSKREIDCIELLLGNNTAPIIAESMSISSRTAESYIENIKLKLNCYTKQELINQLKSNKYLLALQQLSLANNCQNNGLVLSPGRLFYARGKD